MDWTTKHTLSCEVSQAIESSISGLSQKYEPDFIAALIMNLPRKLKDILNKHYLGFQFKVSGCFIHQKPIVEFYDRPSIRLEIGDLLIVYKEVKNNQERYNALLLQAKRTSGIKYSLTGDRAQHQLELYTKWPKFKYSNGKTRSVCPKTISPGAQYLLIDEQSGPCPPFNHCTFWCAKAEKELVASNPLAEQVVELIEFQTGRPFVSKSKNMDGWSSMIWDLLDISSTSCFNRRGAGYCKQDRMSGDSFKFLLTCDASDYFESVNAEDTKSVNGVDDADDKKFFSVLCIEKHTKDSLCLTKIQCKQGQM